MGFERMGGEGRGWEGMDWKEWGGKNRKEEGKEKGEKAREGLGKAEKIERGRRRDKWNGVDNQNTFA